MSEEEMISEIEIYLSHVVQKDFSLPKAIKMMYEEYKRQEDKEKNWEKIYSEDQNYITELNNKIFDLEEKNKELENCLQMAKQIMTADISEDFDCMKLKEFKEYLLNEIKLNENFEE